MITKLVCLRKKTVNIMRQSCFFKYDLSPITESFAGAAAPPPAPPSARTFAPPPPSANVTTKQGMFMLQGVFVF